MSPVNLRSLKLLVKLFPVSLIKSKFTCKPVSNVPSKYVTLNVLYKLISKVTRKLSNSFVSNSASFASDSLDPFLLANL